MKLKTPVQQVMETFDLNKEKTFSGSEVKEILNMYLVEEKSQYVRAFNSGMRDENDNGYDYYNQWYEHRV